MQLHQLKPSHKPKKAKRIGRGGKRGHYSGRGIKGQKARAGAKFKPLIRELIKRYPKLRGHKSKVVSQNSKPTVLNLDFLEKKFNSGEKVSPDILLEKKIVNRIKGGIPKVKILGRGEITKALTVENCLFSKQAKEKIEKAGGTIKSKVQMSNVKSMSKSKIQK